MKLPRKGNPLDLETLFGGGWDALLLLCLQVPDAVAVVDTREGVLAKDDAVLTLDQLPPPSQ